MISKIFVCLLFLASAYSLSAQSGRVLITWEFAKAGIYDDAQHLEYVLLPGTLSYSNYQKIKKTKISKLKANTQNAIQSRDLRINNNEYLGFVTVYNKEGKFNFKKYQFVKSKTKEELKAAAEKEVNLYKLSSYQKHELKILIQPIKKEDKTAMQSLKDWISACKQDALKYLNGDAELEKELENAYQKYMLDSGIRG